MDWIWPLLAAPFAGSFLGVLIARLPEGRPIMLARSACDRCGAPLAPVDLVPLLSFVLLRGACRRCAGAIAPFHWQVELASVAVAVSALAAGSRVPEAWLDCAFGWTLLALAWIDARHMLLPDVLTLPLIPAGLLVTWLLDPAMVTDHALAAALAYTSLRGLALLYRFLRGRDGLGEGDAKLLAALGAWLGLEALPSVVLGAALAGLAAALALRLRGTAMTAATAIPFGPFLALAGWAVWLAR
ncbi:MAG TPA: A24 family peptidase [Acetobacteraceae bacterium]|nr:A24 family peptidase [Acetobacteraceae bacterium]